MNWSLFALVTSISVLTAAACVTLSAADQAAIASDASKIAHCQAVGQACKADGGTNCYGAYDNCMKEAGLH